MSLAGSLGSGQIVFLSGIGATEKMVRSLGKREYVDAMK